LPRRSGRLPGKKRAWPAWTGHACHAGGRGFESRRSREPGPEFLLGDPLVITRGDLLVCPSEATFRGRDQNGACEVNRIAAARLRKWRGKSCGVPI
jgi:hypothetical protein